MGAVFWDLTATMLLTTFLIFPFPLQASAFDISYGWRLAGPFG
jgi:hypothetical protein